MNAHDVEYMQPYPLGVHLADVRQSLGQGVAWHLISILVAEISRLTLGSLGECTGICDGPSHDAPDGRRNLEDVGYGGGIDQFVLARGVSFSLTYRGAYAAGRVAVGTYRDLFLG